MPPLNHSRQIYWSSDDADSLFYDLTNYFVNFTDTSDWLTDLKVTRESQLIYFIHLDGDYSAVSYWHTKLL